jgi:hypothetical protein
LRELAIGAGLGEVHVRFAHRTLRYAPPARLVAGFIITTPVASRYLALSEESRRALVHYAIEQLSGYVDDDGLAVPQENHFLTATKLA